MLTRALLSAALAIAAQLPAAPAPHAVRDGRFHSAALAREVPYQVLLPAGYDASSRRYPVLYLLHGLDGRATDWAGRTALARHAAGRDLIIVTPEGANSWYVNWHDGASERWEDYIVRDLIAEIDARYRTVPARDGRFIAGLSMGGYGAMRIALRHPHVYATAASFSGALQAARLDTYGWTEGLRAEFARAFGPSGGPHRAANDLHALARTVNVLGLPSLYFDCGTSDPFLPANRELAAILHDRKIPYEYREVPGAHNWPYWDRQIVELLRRLPS